MNITLGRNIKENRRRLGLTQEQLAEALGVTTGAVYKWESGRAYPELGLLVETAAFFETSVDALLGYGWEKLGMGQTAGKLRSFAAEHRLDEGIRFAEQALLKYPNSFDVVYRSAELYFLTLRPEYAERAAALYTRAMDLLDQNTDCGMGLSAIQERLAGCFCVMGRMDEAVELLKRNNVSGRNDGRIGLYLSQEEKNAEEALKYLSEALIACYGELFNVCVGYVNAYCALDRPDAAKEIVLWLLDTGRGLRVSGKPSFMDRGTVRLYTILANLSLLEGEEAGAREYLASAYDLAERFDGNPDFRIAGGMKFYHGTQSATYYDDMGRTAMSTIENYIEDPAGCPLKPLWEGIRKERHPK